MGDGYTLKEREKFFGDMDRLVNGNELTQEILFFFSETTIIVLTQAFR